MALREGQSLCWQTIEPKPQFTMQYSFLTATPILKYNNELKNFLLKPLFNLKANIFSRSINEA